MLYYALTFHNALNYVAQGPTTGLNSAELAERVSRALAVIGGNPAPQQAAELAARVADNSGALAVRISKDYVALVTSYEV